MTNGTSLDGQRVRHGLIGLKRLFPRCIINSRVLQICKYLISSEIDCSLKMLKLQNQSFVRRGLRYIELVDRFSPMTGKACLFSPIFLLS